MHTMKKLIVPGLALLTMCSTVLAQGGVFTPPGQQPAEPPKTDPNAPQTPGAGGAGFTPPGEKQRYPGPRGTTFTFPTGLYDEQTPGMSIVLQAAEQARKENKRVLIMLGENMCGFCVFLNDVIVNDPTVRNIVQNEYVLAKINIGKSFRENADVQAKYGIDFFAQTPDGKGVGAPALAVVDAETDKGVGFIGGNAMVAQPMTMDRVFDERKIAEFLVSRQAQPKPAQPVLDDAAVRAAKGDKAILAAFVAPGSESAARLREFIRRADVSSVLEKHFAVAVIDTERMIAGKDVLHALTGDKAAIAPLVAVAGKDGKALGESSTFRSVPRSDEQIKAFVDALATQAPKLGDEDKAVLSKAMVAVWEAAEKK
jgi:hypothetical protein